MQKTDSALPLCKQRVLYLQLLDYKHGGSHPG